MYIFSKRPFEDLSLEDNFYRILKLGKFNLEKAIEYLLYFDLTLVAVPIN